MCRVTLAHSAMPLPGPVRTHGLTHVALAVRDPQRSFAFYQAILGVVCVYDDGAFLQAQTPGSRDVIVFERNARAAGKQGGVAHFGFRLTKASDITRAREAITAARQQLGTRLVALVPVSAQPGKVWGVEEELLPAVAAQLEEVRGVALLRCLKAEADRDKVKRLFAQLYETGKAGAKVAWEMMTRK